MMLILELKTTVILKTKKEVNVRLINKSISTLNNLHLKNSSNLAHPFSFLPQVDWKYSK